MMLADFADYPGNGLSYFNALVLVHAQQLSNTGYQDFVKLGLIRPLCDGAKSN